MAVFWPDSDDEKARHALSQALHRLKREVGEEHLETEGGRIRVSHHVSTDLDEFEVLVESGAAEAAVQQVRGTFLDGVDGLPASNNFEHWIDAQRARVERLHRKARRAAIEEARRSGKDAAAILHARQWIALYPFEDEARHRLIQLLASSNQKGEAIQEYRIYERFLAKEELEPLEETRHLIAALLKAGPVTEPLSTSDPMTAVAAASALRSWKPSLALIVGVIVFAATVLLARPVASRLRLEAAKKDLDDNYALVLPFQIIGFKDDALDLSQASVHMIAHTLNESDVLRAVDGISAISQWEQLGHPAAANQSPGAAVRVARQLGAGKLITGSVIQAAGQATLGITLHDLKTGEKLNTSLTAPAGDSVVTLFVPLAIKLLSMHAGELREAVNWLPRYKRDAVHAYLAGQKEARLGHFMLAANLFDQALTIDSTFALAAARRIDVSNWFVDLDRPKSDKAERIFLRHGEDLITPYTYLFWQRGPNAGMTIESIWAAERAVQNLPRDAVAWWYLGDRVFHGGPAHGIENWQAVTTDALWKSINYGHVYPIEPVFHLSGLALANHDVRALRELKPKDDSYLDSHLGGALHWVLAVGMGDSSAVRKMRRERFAGFHRLSLEKIANHAEYLPSTVGDARLAVQVRIETAPTESERLEALRDARHYLLNHGRPSEVFHPRTPAEQSARNNGPTDDILEALFADGDTVAALKVVNELETATNRPIPADTVARRVYQFNLCRLELWRVSRGDYSNTPGSLDALTGELHRGAPGEKEACKRTIEILYRIGTGADKARLRTLVTELDTIQRLFKFPFARDLVHLSSNLVVARGFEHLGMYPQALAAVRRRGYMGSIPYFLPAYLKDEGRLAALTGDTAGAIKAYQHYLALRADAEPHLQPAVAEVRKQLSLLQDNSR